MFLPSLAPMEGVVIKTLLLTSASATEGVHLTKKELKRILELFDELPQESSDQELWLKLHDAYKQQSKRKKPK